jgi:hypothetical protein
MPPLSLTLRNESPKGYAAQEALPESSPTPKEPGVALGGNPYIRCPLPAFNAGSDTLRQFNESGKVPARRVIPLPIQTVAGGNATVINRANVTSQSGGGGGTVPVTPAVPKTTTISVGTLFPGGIAVLAVDGAKLAALMIVTSTDLCEVRIYGDPSTQANDVPRVTDTAPAFEVTQGLVADVVLDTLPLQWNWQNRIFVNQDSPQTATFYVTVLNPTLGSVTPVVTITFLPLE